MASPGRTARRATERTEKNTARQAEQAARAAMRARPSENGGRGGLAAQMATAAAKARADEDQDQLAAEALAAAAAAQAAEPPPTAPRPPSSLDELPPELRAALEGQLRAAEQDAKPTPARPGRRAKRFEALEQELGALLAFPGPLALQVGDEFCAQHFLVKGPMLAAQLTVYAETHEGTYRVLLWCVSRGGILVVGMALAGFIAPPLMHHGLLPAPEPVRRHYGVPAPAPKTPKPPPARPENVAAAAAGAAAAA